MENTPTRKCLYCEEREAMPFTNFCSHICFELWYSLQQAIVLNNALNRLLDKHFQES